MLVDRIALGKRIKALRQNLGITQDKFAEMLNCTSSHIGKIENGKGGISIEMLVSVANILHTTVDQLLLDSYDYKEQVLLHDFYERIDKFPVQTKVLACDLVMRLLDIMRKHRSREQNGTAPICKQVYALLVTIENPMPYSHHTLHGQRTRKAVRFLRDNLACFFEKNRLLNQNS